MILNVKRKVNGFAIFLVVLLAAIVCCSCVLANANVKELAKLSDCLLSDYSAQFDYCVSDENSDDGTEVSGSAIVSRSNGKITLSVLSPAPYGGICASYAAQDIPDSIVITYEGMSIEMPGNTFDRINAAMALFTDDFALWLRTQPGECVKDGADSEYKSAQVEYNGSVLSLRYDPESCIPVSFTAKRGSTVINAAATGFKAADATE